MKLQHWAHWAEIFASFAVVLSVVFLTIEVRKGARTLESQAIADRAAFNDAYANSPLIPGILAKIKAIDGPEPDILFVERYGLSYEEAAVWARALSRNWTTLESIYVRDGPSQELSDRVALFLLYPDTQLYWDAGAIQIQNVEFRNYVGGLRRRELPISDWVYDWENQLESLKAQWSELPGTAE